MQAVGPLASLHESTRELVDNDDLTVSVDIVHIATIKMVGLERIVDQVGPFHVADGVETFYAS